MHSQVYRKGALSISQRKIICGEDRQDVMKRDETREKTQVKNRPACQIAVRCGPVSLMSIWFRSANTSFSIRPRKSVLSSIPFLLSSIFPRDVSHL